MKKIKNNSGGGEWRHSGTSRTMSGPSGKMSVKNTGCRGRSTERSISSFFKFQKINAAFAVMS